MRTEAQSKSKEGLPYGNLLTELIMDASVDAICYEPTSMRLSPINNGTCRLSLAHGSTSQRPPAAPQHSGGMTWEQQDTRTLLEMEHNILHVMERAVAPIISSVAAMDKRFEKIESMQLELKKTNDEGH
ncbi:hypothetical protein CJ030_MR8G020219 [Morella rubra]|uniref:Uncharacterized protein n=1 Tax=Morella rubra TaxID=262757 RepID=A0A6A1UPE6_9ROSI|nr:hypothetical protein CJ030_MR8G020219 [Morella rubra]